MVDGLEEEAGIGRISESESEVTNGFFKLFRYEDLYKARQNYACPLNECDIGKERRTLCGNPMNSISK